MFVFLIILYGNPFTVRFHLPFSQSDSIYPFYSQIPYTPFTVRFHLLQLESDSIYPFDIQIPSNPFSVRFHETFDKPQCDPRAGTPSGVPRLRARIYIYIYIYISRSSLNRGGSHADFVKKVTFFTKLRIPEPGNGFWEL